MQTRHINEISSADHRRGLLAASVVVLCWSGFNIVSRRGGTGVLLPYDLAALRFGVSGLIALPFFAVRVPLVEWPRYLVLALFGGLGYALLVYAGFAHAPVAHAGVFVNGGIPFWTIVIVAVTSGFRLPWRVALALLITTCGLALMASTAFTGAAGTGLGDGLFLLAALSWAVFGLLMRRWLVKPFLAIAGVASLSMLIFLPIYVLWLPKGLGAAGAGEIVLQAVYQGVVAGLVAGGLYSYANHKIGACGASMMLALVPGVSAVGAHLLLGEPLEGLTIAGLVTVSVGALLTALPARGGR